ncbi:S28 family serine protease [Tenacibaculum maritimum]|uniref:S28 family serine protease n=1 Tax=Tenacibaculum maritimum TaxID=107401 RepID=UPI0012E436C9|nr:S28 family serine protease [Tenacibaculum maritimum]CAA0219914.1 Probable lipoprotein precursor. Putative peptidase S37 [Tenacibaculum maritimum]
MNCIKHLWIVILLGIISCKNSPKKEALKSFKEQLIILFPKASIDSIVAKDHFTEAYQVVLEEKLNPKDASAGTFKHYMYVSHANYEQPTVLITDGYSSSNRTTELSKLLKGNQVIVEYRMYGKSRPDSIPWQYLTNDNAIEDYHGIVTKLKTLYKGKWLSSGISKGGETTLIYKAKYPKDVDVAVPYVAPLINGVEDVRTNDLIDTIGTEACRKAIKKVQRNALKQRKEVLNEMQAFAKKNKMHFTEVNIEEALEYAVLELPFSFWQWNAQCENIPGEKATAKELFEYINAMVGVDFYSDNGYKRYLPSFYQHMKELGYYGFDITPVKDLLKIVKNTSNSRFAPKGVDLTYNSEYIKEVRNYIEHQGDQILYIYGEYDPWGACAPTPKPTVDALKMVLKEGHHGTRIASFSKENQQKIYAKLQDWLGEGVKIYPLK